MTRIFGHFVSVEMLKLWLIEFPLGFLLFYGVFALGSRDVGFVVASEHGALGPAIVAVVAINVAAAAVGLYRPEVCFEFRRFIAGMVIASALGFGALLTASVAFPAYFPSYLATFPRQGRTLFIDVVAIFALWTSGLIFIRIAFGWLTRSGLFRRSILIVGGEPEWLRLHQHMPIDRGAFFRIAGYASPASASIISAEQLLKDKIWGIVVGPQARKEVDPAALMRCKALGIRVFNEVEFRESYLQRVDTTNLCPGWLAYAEGFSCDPVSSTIRRALDIVFSLLLLLVTLPVMILATIAIKLDSPGPVFYRQERVGLFGRSFWLTKFRSMQLDAESAGVPRWATKSDSRVTRVGAFLRFTRIDELPQILNVLRGEMSLIGPRPERPHFVQQLSEAIPCYNDRAYVKPGITGWAQVNFPYGASVEDARMKLAYDLYYVKHRSLFLDLLILISTVRVILFQEGAR